MKKLLLCLVFGVALSHSATLTLDPADGALRGGSGQVLGWKVTLESAANEWTTVIASFTLNETNPSHGIYSDLLGMSGVIVGPGGSLTADLGQYIISPPAILGDVNYGTIKVLYETFSDNPEVCSNCYVGSAEADLQFSVTTVPEPSTLLSAAAALFLVAARRLRRA